MHDLPACQATVGYTELTAPSHIFKSCEHGTRAARIAQPRLDSVFLCNAAAATFGGADPTLPCSYGCHL